MRARSWFTVDMFHHSLSWFLSHAHSFSSLSQTHELLLILSCHSFSCNSLILCPTFVYSPSLSSFFTCIFLTLLHIYVCSHTRTHTRSFNLFFPNYNLLIVSGSVTVHQGTGAKGDCIVLCQITFLDIDDGCTGLFLRTVDLKCTPL